jgi:hypothetical protein
MIKKLPYLVLALVVSCGQNPKSESNESLVFVEEITAAFEPYRLWLM